MNSDKPIKTNDCLSDLMDLQYGIWRAMAINLEGKLEQSLNGVSVSTMNNIMSIRRNMSFADGITLLDPGMLQISLTR